MERSEQLLRLLRHGNQLKRTARTGWVQRGGQAVYTVEYGVAFAAYLLAQLGGEREPVDVGRVLALALLHDLPEGVTSDVPAPAWRFLPAGAKAAAEAAVVDNLFAGWPRAAELHDLWAELQSDETVESHIVHDADKLDLYLQALTYEQQTGNTHLAEFWREPHAFHFPPAQEAYDLLRRERQRMSGT